MRAEAMPGPKGNSKSKPHLWIALLLFIHLAICFLVLAKNVNHPNTSERLVSSDSVHYLDIARDFCSGDFSMKYVKERPHRQPLYPALLAIVMKLGNGNRFMLGAVNILCTCRVDPLGLRLHACAVRESFCCWCERVGLSRKSVY